MTDFLHTVDAVPSAKRVSARNYTHCVVTTYDPEVDSRVNEERAVASVLDGIQGTYDHYSKVVLCTFKPRVEGGSGLDAWGDLYLPSGKLYYSNTYPGEIDDAKLWLAVPLAQRLAEAEGIERDRYRHYRATGVRVSVASWHQSAKNANAGAEKALQHTGIVRAEVHATKRVPALKRERDRWAKIEESSGFDNGSQ